MALNCKYSWSEMEQLQQNWGNFSKENGGEFKIIQAHSYGNIEDPTLRKFEMSIPFAESQIIFLTTEINPLKVNFLFNTAIFNEFLMYPEDFTDKICKLFGFKEIEIGDNEFDKNFIIKGSDEIFMKKVLFHELKKFLLENYIANFKLENGEKGIILELNLVINEIETENLQILLTLFKECIIKIKGN
jgi:hypothetical protein